MVAVDAGVKPAPAAAHVNHEVWYQSSCRSDVNWKAIGYSSASPHTDYEYEVQGGTGGHPSWSPRYYWSGARATLDFTNQHGQIHGLLIQNRWAAYGWECGSFGAPLRDAQAFDAGGTIAWVMWFEGGYIVSYHSGTVSHGWCYMCV